MTDDLGIVNGLRCPNCRRKIPEEFSRFSPPFMYSHTRSNRRNCRLVIILDPWGSNHRIVVVPSHIDMGDVIRQKMTAEDLFERAGAMEERARSMAIYSKIRKTA